MIEVTKIQKDTFLAFAKKYDSDVFAIISRGAPDQLDIITDAERDELLLFSQKIGSLVLTDHPDYNEGDENVNEDAMMISFIITDLIHDFQKKRKT